MNPSADSVIRLEDLASPEGISAAEQYLRRYYQLVKLLDKVYKAEFGEEITQITREKDEALAALDKERPGTEGMMIVLETQQEGEEITALIDVEELRSLVTELEDENIRVANSLGELLQIIDQGIRALEVPEDKKSTNRFDREKMTRIKIEYVQWINSQFLQLLNQEVSIMEESTEYVSSPSPDKIKQLLDLVMKVTNLLANFSVEQYRTAGASKGMSKEQIKQSYYETFLDAYTELAGLLYFLRYDQATVNVLNSGGKVEIIADPILDQKQKTDWQIVLTNNAGEKSIVNLQVKSTEYIENPDEFVVNVNGKSKSAVGSLVRDDTREIDNLDLPGFAAEVIHQTQLDMDETLEFNLNESNTVIIVHRPRNKYGTPR